MSTFFCCSAYLPSTTENVSIRSYSGPRFPAFGMNTRDTEFVFVLTPNAEKCGPE